jgi:integrase
MHKLTIADILALARPGRHPDGGSTYIQLSPSLGLSVVFRYKFAGASHWLGCGALDRGNLAETLAAGRQRADEARRRLAAGEDPLAHKRAVVASQAPARAMTMREVATAYLAVHGAGWRNRKHRAQWQVSLDRHILPVVGKIDAAAVDVDHVKQILADIWRRRPETARRTRGRLELLLDFAAAHKYRTAENPARQRLVAQMLGKGRPPVKHHPALPYRELPALFGKLEDRGTVAGYALMWIMCTATRSQEARGALWTELDTAKRMWVVPAERMKRKREHRVPLSDAALFVLKQLKPIDPKAQPFVFPGQTGDTPISDTALRNVLRTCGVAAEAGSTHGMRSSFKDWCAEEGIDDPVSEAALAHVVPGKVLAAYRRTDFLAKRVDAMQRWGAFLWFG